MRIDTIKLITLMYKKGIKTGDIVKSSGLSKSTVSCIKSGKSCTTETAGKLAKALNVSLSDITEE